MTVGAEYSNIALEVNPHRKGDAMPTPPSLTPPSLSKPKPRKKLADAVPIIGKVLCFLGKHDVNPGDFIDSHGNWDALSYCNRCRELDV